MPAVTSERIPTQNNRPVHHVRPDVEKVRNKFRVLAKVSTTKPRLAAMVVEVNMEHADFVVKSELESFPQSCGAHHRSHRVILQVVAVGNRMEVVRQYDPAGWLNSANSARQEADPLCSEGVRAPEVCAGVIEQVGSDFESNPHRRALRCWTRISAGRWPAST
jgi:hypothetical protein